jgi:hypothetical protein
MYNINYFMTEANEQINAITVHSSKSEVLTITTQLVTLVDNMIGVFGLQAPVTTKEEASALNKAIANATVATVDPKLYEFEDVLAKTKLSNYVTSYVEYINNAITTHVLSLINGDVVSLMKGKVFDYPALNDNIPQLKVYKRVEIDTQSGLFCTINNRQYTLTMLFPNDITCADTVSALSYELTSEQLAEATAKANETCSNESNTTNISVTAKFYKNAIGQTSNKYYKSILNDLCCHVATKLMGVTDVKPKLFNAICLEWLASKACRDTKLVGFKARASFDADSYLYQYVKTAMFEQDNFAKIH